MTYDYEKEKQQRKLRTITVGELIKELSALPQDLPVYADGCDCIGEAIRAVERDDPYEGHHVEIERVESADDDALRAADERAAKRTS